MHREIPGEVAAGLVAGRAIPKAVAMGPAAGRAIPEAVAMGPAAGRATEEEPGAEVDSVAGWLKRARVNLKGNSQLLTSGNLSLEIRP